MGTETLQTIEILLIEDNLNDAELTIRALKGSHIDKHLNITHLKDGAEAIDYFFSAQNVYVRPSSFPKVILLDLKLPKVDGIQVLRKLKSNTHTQSIPVVILTSSKEEKDIIETYNLGVNSYVTKPVEFEEFMSSIANLGIYWGLVNQSPGS
jgi:two-component system response regulator